MNRFYKVCMSSTYFTVCGTVEEPGLVIHYNPKKTEEEEKKARASFLISDVYNFNKRRQGDSAHSLHERNKTHQ